MLSRPCVLASEDTIEAMLEGQTFATFVGPGPWVNRPKISYRFAHENDCLQSLPPPWLWDTKVKLLNKTECACFGVAQEKGHGGHPFYSCPCSVQSIHGLVYLAGISPTIRMVCSATTVWTSPRRGYPFQIDGRKQKQLLDCWCLQVCVMLISGSHSVKHGEMRWSLMLCRGPSAYWVNRLLGRRSTTFGWSFTGTKPTSWCFAVVASKIEILQERFWRYLRSLIEVFEVFQEVFLVHFCIGRLQDMCNYCVFLLARMMQGVASPEQKWSSAGKFNRRGWLLSLEESLCIFCMLKSVQVKLEVKLHDTHDTSASARNSSYTSVMLGVYPHRVFETAWKVCAGMWSS